MTIPSRPAPPPPSNVVGNNNNNLSQYQRQQQNGGVVVPKLTIKLPPPPTKGVPKGGGGLAANNYASTSSIYRSNSNNSLTSNGVTNSSSSSSSTSSSITRKFPMANVRYAPTTNWDGSPFEPMMVNGKKAPPPRPPPPKIANGHTTPPTQSVNILSNIFGRKKSTKAPKRPSQRPGVVSTSASHSNSIYGTSSGGSLYSSFPPSTLFGPPPTASAETNVQLISFDSPPSSPTFTQKSNSDCVSVDSFSSDSNFSSPNNGSVSQPESGFEDDFSSSRATTSPLDPWDTFTSGGGTSELTTIGSAPVRNYNVVNNRIQQNSDNQLCNGKSLLPPPSVLHMPTIIKPKISQKPKAPKPPPAPLTMEQIRYDLAIGGSGGNKSLSNDEAVTPPSPPMPNCPPPPPPPGGYSILDVIKGDIDIDALSLGAHHYDDGANEQAYGIALYEFDGAVEGDLSFRENEKIYILEKLNDEWLRGRNRSGCEGIFPTNYIDIKVPLKDNNTDISRTTTTTLTSHSASTVTFSSSSSSSSSYTQSYQHEKKEVIKNNFANCAKTPNNNSNLVRCLYTFDAGEPGDLVFQENDYVAVLYRINEDWLFGEAPDGRQGQFPANFLEYIPENIPMP